jgi:hypothetical protein
MKIFYQEEKTIPMGDFKFRKIAFGIEDNVDYQMETADEAIKRIRDKVLDVLEAASKWGIIVWQCPHQSAYTRIIVRGPFVIRDLKSAS